MSEAVVECVHSQTMRYASGTHSEPNKAQSWKVICINIINNTLYHFPFVLKIVKGIWNIHLKQSNLSSQSLYSKAQYVCYNNNITEQLDGKFKI